MSNHRVAILVPPETPDAPADQADTFRQAREIHQCLTILGKESLTVVHDGDGDGTDRALLEAAPAVVVNLVEDLPEGPQAAFRVAERLDRLGIPYTGAKTAALRALGDKREMKRRLREAGLPVADDLEASASAAKATSPHPLPRRERVHRGTASPFLPRGGEVGPVGPGGGALPQLQSVASDAPPERYIIKSAVEHASIGLDDTSVVQGRAAAEGLLARRRATGGAWFAEHYIDGREFNVAILETGDGPQVLPVAEILFLAHADRPRILGYAEKWAEDSSAYAATPRRFATDPTDAPLLGALARLALAAWRAFDLTGYARVDFRVDAAGRPYILEVNANPCLAANAGFCAAASEAGMAQTDVVAHLIETARVRTDPLAPDRRAGRPPEDF